jgi:N-acetylglucosaminyldiphosphoundecaprenol N-acetyl-beta-D-mannosaminyltransferase
MDHPAVNNIQRITLLKVPLDIVPEAQIPRIAREFAEDESHKNILFLTYSQFIKARRDPEFLSQLNKATLVIPVSKSLEMGCRFLKLATVVRHYPFDFTIKFLGALEEKKRTLYLLGEHHDGIQTIAANMRTSFPGLTLIGRHTGHYSRDKEEPILKAIQKATPTVLLIGPGVPGRQKWAFRQGANLPVKITLYSEEAFKIMAGRKKRPSKAAFRKGTYELHRSLFNPLRLARVFSYAAYGLLLLVQRLRKKVD